MRRKRLGFCVGMVALGLAGPSHAGEETPWDRLKFRAIGPAIGGRVARVAGVAGDPLTYYAATAQSGVWKSVDGGRDWSPIFDDQKVLGTGSIAVAASDPNVIYVGTGEANIRGNVQPGVGIFRSVDAGKSWEHVWTGTGQIGTIVVHPKNPDVAWAAVLGHAFGANAERGVYRTVDGGRTWQQVLAKDEDTGASDIAVDPSNPRILFAGLWQARRFPWGMTSGGPGSGLYRSSDGGESWKRLEGDGLPEGIWGKVGVAVAPSDGQRVYALIEAEKGGLFRSDDGGGSWKRINDHAAIRQRAWYYSTLTVDPRNADIVWLPQVPMLRSIDGGRSVQSVRGLKHGDNHDVWIDPADPRRMIVGNDGGVDLTVDGGASWSSPAVAWSQFYNVDADERVPYHVGGTIQDEGTASGPSNSLRSEGIVLADWTGAGGGEAGDFVFDRKFEGRVYAGEYGGIMTRFDEKSGNERNVSYYPTNPSGHGAEDLRVRFQWTAPLVASKKSPGVVYHAANVLLRSSDGGQSWVAISPDLTRNDKSKQQWSGGPITGDNTGVEIYDTIFSLAESPFDGDEIWAGTDDGLLHVTRDGGRNWTNVTPPGLREWATIESIALSPSDRRSAWIAVDAHRLDDNRPYVYRTRDGGATWEAVVTGFPEDSFVLAVREDPERAGLLYAGTRTGVFVSRDGGDRWQPLRLNLPPVVVTDLEVVQGDLVVATSGRSLWILDDLSALRAWDGEAGATPAVDLFDPRPARRWARTGSWSSEGAFENPPTGAILHYRLGEAARGEVTLEVFDATGRRVRRLSSIPRPQLYPEDDPDEPMEAPKPELGTEAGLHRAIWDLRWDGATRLTNAKIDLGDTDYGPTAVPGRYRLRLTVDGQTDEAAFDLLPDPRATASPAELAEQLDFALRIRGDLSRLAEEIERLRAIRSQTEELATHWKLDPRAADLVPAAERLVERCDELEAELHNPDAKVVYDILAQRGGTQLHSNLVFLYMSSIWGASAPTQGEREVYAELAAEQAALSARAKELERVDLADLERRARDLGLSRVLLRRPIESEDLDP